MFNTIRYADQLSPIFLNITLLEKSTNEVSLLGIRFSNAISREDRSGLGTGNGLYGIAEDLRQLNNSEKQELTLYKQQNNGLFEITLFYREDLLLVKEQKPLPMPINS